MASQDHSALILLIGFENFREVCAFWSRAYRLNHGKKDGVTFMVLSSVTSSCRILRRSANLFFRSWSPVAPLGLRQVATTWPLSFFSSSCLTYTRKPGRQNFWWNQNRTSSSHHKIGFGHTFRSHSIKFHIKAYKSHKIRAYRNLVEY